MDNILYYELETIYGPLYIYEKYQGDPKTSNEIPETREFFTQEKGERGWGNLCFLNKSKFETVHRNFEGNIVKNYMKELSPYEFLSRVSGYIESDKQIEEKRMSVYIIFELNSLQRANNQIIYEDPPMTQEEKDHVASKILAKYLS